MWCCALSVAKGMIIYMKKVYILYRRFFDMDGKFLTVGGIQTYISQLIEVIEDMGMIPVLVQFADKSFNQSYYNVEVCGVKVKHTMNEREKSKVSLKFIKKRFNKQDFIIFATEDLYVPTFTKRVLAIQHGITWDIPRGNSKLYLINMFRKSIANYRRLVKTKKLNNMVCVDYNYLNWLRTQTRNLDKNMYVIPNSTKINRNHIDKDSDKVRVIFARRFETYRGTKLFAKVISAILEKYDNVHVTFAGEGKDEEYLKHKFKTYNRVNFIKYKSEDSLEIHGKFHIAVIPTLGSEGTSLSLLEAMASNCATIATNVGGMTNIILDNFNGILINPKENELYQALDSLINNRASRDRIAENAYLTASQSFNNELWRERWKKVLYDLDLK